MTCHHLDLGKGMTAIVCTPRQRRKRCSSPGCTNWGELLCDFPVVREGKEGTCDKAMCRRCAKSVGPDRDFCRPHSKVESKAPEKKAAWP